MKFLHTPLNGCIVMTPAIFSDSRGSFYESYKKGVIDEALGYEVNFVQDNESFSSKGVLRGLHFQKGEYAQAKLVRVIQGAVLDVAVDLREESSTYGQHFSIELSSDNKKQLFIPRGFAHGFVVLSDTAIFSYKCDNYYHKDSESGIIYNDPTLNIDWKFPNDHLQLSKKDLELPHFKSLAL
ncbi:MAG: dTDP-4-dehydrorhamnose 3,5-epimerase [Bacteroidetes bacterium]|nr:dTDP-4-dehydrorhamnose 3,5-epimerase [Bacteroidota bacterium]MDA0860300.1 dTDP-4-dehydrorhamnose 3,5-epimerase [Bacteroidota bacterium]MDA1318508.1 dTDP-4-dehydrorhamnose 3,5-epimerase [Bacteroidota bacterium]